MKFQIMDQTGHTTEVLETAKKVDLRKAMERFDELTKTKGMRAAVKVGDGQHKLVKAFDPNAEEMIFFPQLKGG